MDRRTERGRRGRSCWLMRNDGGSTVLSQTDHHRVKEILSRRCRYLLVYVCRGTVSHMHWNVRKQDSICSHSLSVGFIVSSAESSHGLWRECLDCIHLVFGLDNDEKCCLVVRTGRGQRSYHTNIQQESIRFVHNEPIQQRLKFGCSSSLGRGSSTKGVWGVVRAKVKWVRALLPAGWHGSVWDHGGWGCGRCPRLLARRPGAAGNNPCYQPHLRTRRTGAALEPRPWGAERDRENKDGEREKRSTGAELGDKTWNISGTVSQRDNVSVCSNSQWKSPSLVRSSNSVS